jgi:hypothetical protein
MKALLRSRTALHVWLPAASSSSTANIRELQLRLLLLPWLAMLPAVPAAA